MKIRDEIQQGKYIFSKPEWDIATSIYEKLGRGEPLSKRIVIKPWYGRDGVNKAKANGYVYTMRVPGMRYHLGNPFTPEARLS